MTQIAHLVSFLLLVLTQGILATSGLTGVCRSRNYTSVADFDAIRYLGTWFEITRSESFPFGRDCVCVTAQYSLINSKAVKVDNTCRKNEVTAAPFSQIGRARIVRPGTGALRVSFFLHRIPFIRRLFEAGYDVVLLDPEYQWAGVVSCSRVAGSNFWILARTPTLDEELIYDIYNKASDMGIDLTDQMRTTQEGCWK